MSDVTSDEDGSGDIPSGGGSGRNDHYFALPPGTRLMEYEIESVLGHGGFGITYLARDTLLEEQVAIKEYLPNEMAIRISDATVRAKSEGDRSDFETGLKSFLEEARLMARFRHGNIVHVRRFFEMHGTGYIVLNYERGGTLASRLDAGPPPEADLRKWIDGILDGLDAVHQQAALHRDLKPNNVIVREDGSPVLIDFGAARDFKGRRSRSITAIATPGYSPPEQYGVGGQQGPWTDFYALGAILYRAVSGNPPIDSLRRLRNDALVPAETVAKGRYDAKLLRTIDWMLKVDEAERPTSVAEVRDALKGAAIPKTGGRADAPAAAASPSRRKWLVAAMLLVSVAAAAGGYGFYDARQKEVARLEAERQVTLRQQLAEAKFDKAALDRFVAACGARCAPEMAAEAKTRLDTIAAEEAAYREAAGDKAKLRAFADACKACGLQADARRDADEIDRREREAQMARLTRRLEEVAYNRAALERFLSECGPTCPDTLRAQAQAKLDLERSETLLFRNASEDAERLRAYVRDCRICAYKSDAETQLARLDRLRREAERRDYTNRLSAAGYDRSALNRFITACIQPACPLDLRNDARGTLELLDNEERSYQAADGDVDSLRAFLRSCRACVQKLTAQARIATLEEEEKRSKRGIAIAMGKKGSGLHWEAAWNYPDVDSAKNLVMSRCKRQVKTCQVAWGQGPTCIALAYVGNGWATRGGDTSAEARDAAMAACRSVNKEACKLAGSWCNS